MISSLAIVPTPSYYKFSVKELPDMVLKLMFLMLENMRWQFRRAKKININIL